MQTTGPVRPRCVHAARPPWTIAQLDSAMWAAVRSNTPAETYQVVEHVAGGWNLDSQPEITELDRTVCRLG